jgi:hypothetical protein
MPEGNEAVSQISITATAHATHPEGAVLPEPEQTEE